MEDIDINLKDKIELPSEISEHYLNDIILLIAKNKGTWLTLCKMEYQMIKYIQKGLILKSVIEEFAQNENTDYESSITIFKSLMRQLMLKKFYNNAQIDENSNDDFSIQLHLTNECNLRCINCYANCGQPKTKELSEFDWRKIILEFKRLGGKSIIISGGEPFLKHYLPELLSFIKENNLKTLVISNGTLIDRNIIDKIKDNIDIYRISLDGTNSEINDYIRGKGSFEKVINTLKILTKIGAEIELAITIYKENYKDFLYNFSSFVAFLTKNEINITRFQIGRGEKQGRASDSIDILRFEDIYRKIYQNIYGNYWELENYSPSIKKSCGIGDSLVVTPDGIVNPCIRNYDTSKNIKNYTLKSIVKLYKQIREESNVDNIEYCAKCDLKYICGGGCRVDNFSKNGDFTKPFCDNKWKNEFYQRLVNRDQIFQQLSVELDN